MKLEDVVDVTKIPHDVPRIGRTFPGLTYHVPAPSHEEYNVHKLKQRIENSTKSKRITFDVDELLRERGFEAINASTIDGFRTYWRENHEVPNFMSEPTVLTSGAGVYTKYGTSKHLVVRTEKSNSDKPFSFNDFEADLETITKQHLDRPTLFGHPNETFVNAWNRKLMASTLIGSLLLTSTAGPILKGNEIISYGNNQDLLIGSAIYSGVITVCMGVVSMITEAASMDTMKKSLPDAQKYAFGNNAVWQLNTELVHQAYVQAQTEVHERLRDSMPRAEALYNKDLFNKKVYEQLSQEQREDRINQILAGQTGETETVDVLVNQALALPILRAA